MRSSVYARNICLQAALEEVGSQPFGEGELREPWESTRVRQHCFSTHFFTFVTTITSGSLFTCRSLKMKKILR